MNISSVTENDLPELAILYQQLIPNEVSIPKMKSVLNGHGNNPNHIILGAEIDGNLVGSLLAVVCEMLFGQCKLFMVVKMSLSMGFTGEKALVSLLCNILKITPVRQKKQLFVYYAHN